LYRNLLQIPVVVGSQAFSLLFADTSCQTGSVGVGRCQDFLFF